MYPSGPDTKWLLAFPMFAAAVASRGFTLAVFIKETLTDDDKSNAEWIVAVIVLIIYLSSNVAIFKLCGQDLVRSFLFGLSSTLLPTGYNNAQEFYQCPNQPIDPMGRSKYNAEDNVGSPPNAVHPESFQLNTSGRKNDTSSTR